MDLRERIVAEARKLQGTKFHHQGRVPHAGIDCIGLLVCVARALELEHQDSTNYRRRPAHGRLKQGLKKSGLIEIPKEEAGNGDVIAIWVKTEENVQHVGILTDAGMIHTNQDVGFVSEHVLNDKIKSRIDSAWRFPGVE